MPGNDTWAEMFLVDAEETAAMPARRTLSFSRTPTVLLTFAANRFTRQSAAALQAKFSIGAMDWRMLVMLTRHPGATVALSAETIGIDKAAISRSLQRLEEKGLAAPMPHDNDPRRKDWTLTKEGEVLHAEILTVVLDRLEQQLAGFSDEEIKEFTRLLGKFHRNLEKTSGSENA